MTTLNELRSQADEIAPAGHAGWGNTMRDAADEIDRLRTEAVAADIRIENDKLEFQRIYAVLRSHAEITQKAEAERDAERADAKRYQWLRSRVPGGAYRIMGVIYSEGGAAVDESIDKAMGEQS